MGAGGRRAAAFKRVPVGDPYFSFVKLLLKFDGDFAEATGKTITAYGSPAFSTSDKVFGTASCIFDGANDGLDVVGAGIGIAASTDFVIEGFIKLTVQQTDKFILGFRGQSSSSGLIVGTGTAAAGVADGVLRFRFGEVERATTTRIDDNQWRYFRAVRSGTNLALYTGTVASGTASREYYNTSSGSASNSAATTRPRIGSNDFQDTPASNFITGLFDSLRVTVGSARGYNPADSSVSIPTTDFPSA